MPRAFSRNRVAYSPSDCIRLDRLGRPGCALDELTFSGTMEADVILGYDPTDGTVIGGMQIQSGNIALTDGSWLVPSGFNIFVVDTAGVMGTMSSPFALGNPVAFQTSELELQGSVLTLDEGVMTIVSVPIVDITVQFDAEPMVFNFSQSSVATETLTETLPDLFEVEVSIPISVFTTHSSLDISMDGMLVMTGVVAKPLSVPSLSNTGLLAVAVLLAAISFATLGQSQRTLYRKRESAVE